MIRILPLVEGFVLANIATQNLFETSPIGFLLGDLNESTVANPNALQVAKGPSDCEVISLKDLLTNSMNVYSQTRTGQRDSAQVGGVFGVVSDNFMNNMGNIIVGSVASTAGFRIAKKVLRKPISMANKTLRNAGLGSTVQF